MQRAFGDLSYDFLFPKLHGMWADAMVGKPLHDLIYGGREQALERYLNATGIDYHRRAEVQRSLIAVYLDTMSSVRRLLDPNTAGFYTALIERYFFENIKTVLRYHYFPDRDVDIRLLMIESPHLPLLPVPELLGAATTHQLFTLLPRHPVRKQLLPVLVELDDSKNFFIAESRINRLYYAYLLDRTSRLPLAVRRTALELVGTDIDINNLILILRNAHLYGLEADVICDLCIDGGQQITPRHQRRLAAAESDEEMLAAMPLPYSRISTPLMGDTDLYVVENDLWQFLFSRAYKAFRDYNRPALSVVAFPILKHFESVNVSRVFEGIRFGLNGDEISSMMIGASHV